MKFRGDRSIFGAIIHKDCAAKNFDVCSAGSFGLFDGHDVLFYQLGGLIPEYHWAEMVRTFMGHDTCLRHVAFQNLNDPARMRMCLSSVNQR